MLNAIRTYPLPGAIRRPADAHTIDGAVLQASDRTTIGEVTALCEREPYIRVRILDGPWAGQEHLYWWADWLPIVAATPVQ